MTVVAATNWIAGPLPLKFRTPPVARVPRLAKLRTPPVPLRLMVLRPEFGVKAPTASLTLLPTKLNVPPEIVMVLVLPPKRLARPLPALSRVSVPPGFKDLVLLATAPAAPLSFTVPAWMKSP